MKALLKAIGWMVLGLTAVAVWFAFPDIQPIVGAGLVAGFAYHITRTVIEEAIRRSIAPQIDYLKQQNHEIKRELEDIRRYAAGIWKDVSDRQQQRW